MSDFSQWVAIALVDAAPSARGAFLPDIEAVFETYRSDPSIDWSSVHRHVRRIVADAPTMSSPYWAGETPISVIALWPSADRARLAADVDTPLEVVRLLSRDRDPRVAKAARLNVSRDHSSKSSNSKPALAPSPGTVTPPPATPADDLKIGRWGLAFVMISVLLVIGFDGAYTHEVEARPAQEATVTEAATGMYDIESTSQPICGGGEDFLSCVNQHVAVFNSACTTGRLTLWGDMQCNQLGDFIDESQQEYARCGSGCLTIAEDDGTWGFNYLTAVPETEMQTNDDAVEAVMITRRCHFSLGPIKIGECERRSVSGG